MLSINGPLLLIAALHLIIPSSGESNEDMAMLLNDSSVLDILKVPGNPYLDELSGFWNFNDTLDISKYEDFDHTRYEGSPQETLEELLKEMRTGRLHKLKAQVTPPPDMPVFETDPVTNLSVQLGATVHLTCKIKNLRNRAVSWVRRRDWHILTSGMFTYTNDDRFQVIHQEGSDSWTLQIKYVQKRDHGTYECQVSTVVGSRSHVFHVAVIAPVAYILGSGEYHIGEGSTISLVCIIENSPAPPEYVMWYHNNELINYKGQEGRIQVLTEPGEKTHSRLLIAQATRQHTGNYTCTAQNTEPDSVYVFVSTGGDNMAAIQSAGRRSSKNILLASLALAVISINILDRTGIIS